MVGQKLDLVGESDFDEEIVPNPNNVGSSLPLVQVI